MGVTRRSVLAGSVLAGGALSSVALTLGTAWPAAAGTQSFGGHAFGSTWRVVGGPDIDGQRLRPLIEEIVQTVDAHMSPWRADSLISRFNQNASTDWQPMSADVCQVTAQSLAIAAATEGAFDPTIGPAVARFGFGPIEGGAGSFNAISVQAGGIRKADPDLTLDLCGIAKGYALDRIADLLRTHGIDNALIEVGGEVITMGNHPARRAWKVAIQHPEPGRGEAHRIIAPRRLALASSGHTPQGYRGRIALSHLIDPAAQRPATNSLLSVSVLAPTAMEADGLATALTVLGLERGVACAEALGVSALFLAEGDNAPIETLTGRFANHLVV